MAENRNRPKTLVIDETPSASALEADPGRLSPEIIAERKDLARYLLDPVMQERNPESSKDAAMSDTASLVNLKLAFPSGLAPTPKPDFKTPDPEARLSKADVLVITWTVAEQNALADVLTPGYTRKVRSAPNKKRVWYQYTRNFNTYLPSIRKGAPARGAKALGSWMRTQIGGQDVVCFKSELHLNQDSIRDPKHPGTATLPVKDLLHQLIEEVNPSVVITVGTSGGVFDAHDLGDVAVTRAAKFRLDDEFKNAHFNHMKYTNEWDVPTSRFDDALELMAGFKSRLVEPEFLPPTRRFPWTGPGLLPRVSNRPDIKFEDLRLPGQTGTLMPKLHPILTTDYFEFGTSVNRLDKHGCAVEMGDAVLGLVCSELADPPSWVVVRNLSDPVINGALPTNPRDLPPGQPRTKDMQAHWAVWYYETYGYWTSVMSALTTWGIIAGLDD